MRKREGRFALVSESAIRALDAPELRVYAALRLHSSRDVDRCYPTEKAIAELLRVSQRQIRHIVKRLVEKRAVAHRRIHGRWRWYFPLEGTPISGGRAIGSETSYTPGEQEVRLPTQQEVQLPLPKTKQMPQTVGNRKVARSAVRGTLPVTAPAPRSYQKPKHRGPQDMVSTLNKAVRKYGRVTDAK